MAPEKVRSEIIFVRRIIFVRLEIIFVRRRGAVWRPVWRVATIGRKQKHATGGDGRRLGDPIKRCALIGPVICKR